jgi:hypothetical protein
METDSVYRDSVRLVIRDSLMKNNPQFRKRMEERQKEEELKKEELQKQDSLPQGSADSSNRSTAVFHTQIIARDERTERSTDEQ